MFIVLSKGLVESAQNWTLERSLGRRRARHITVTHLCGDHTCSCLTWLLRVSALALCHPSLHCTNSGVPPISLLYQQWCATHLPSIPTAVYHPSPHCTNSGVPPIFPLYLQSCATHLPTIPTAVHHPSPHYTNSSAPLIFPLYQQQCTTHLPTIPTVVCHPSSHYTNSSVLPISLQ